MTKRRSVSQSDSLDLLLDTICNTFGAVIFISILVAILAGRSGPESNSQLEQSATETLVQECQQQIAAARIRLRQLSTQHAQQQRLIDRLTSDESRHLASQVVAVSQQHLTLSEERASRVMSVSEIQASNVEVNEQLNRQAGELARTTEVNRQLHLELSKAVELAARTATIPKVRRTTKQGVAYMLHRSKLHRATTPDGFIDDVDCIESDRLGTTVIAPRPGAGVKVTSEEDPGLKKRLIGIRKSEHFVRLFVSRDSFAQFQPLKTLFIRSGFEYEVILFSEGSAELVLAPSDIESFVQ
ncbi:MAG: hypothetical protein R3C20_05895 [Planctomycetaceae bacterium]